MAEGAGETADPGSRQRFAFGENWRNYADLVNEDRIDAAKTSLIELLKRDRLDGQRFLDVGSGSGLFSLAAHRLGAEVYSFDFDARSVECTELLRLRFGDSEQSWQIRHGSILDADFVRDLGQWDIVYSWGVLHHTGAMWRALENVASLVSLHGEIVIAIYNDQGRASKRWLTIKRLYNRIPVFFRWLIVLPCLLRLWGPTVIRDTFTGYPLRSWRNYARESIRGMSPWHDALDWIGGLPFEFAKPEQIFDFYRDRGFELLALTTCAGGIGCNEFVFTRR